MLAATIALEIETFCNSISNVNKRKYFLEKDEVPMVDDWFINEMDRNPCWFNI